MSFHEPARDVKPVGNFSNAQPFKQCAKYALISRPQPFHQQREEIAGDHGAQKAFVEFQTVAPIVPFITMVWKRCLRPAVFRRVNAASGCLEVTEIKPDAF